MIPTMNKLTRADLFPLERYSAERAEFRARVIAHKKKRNIPLGPHISLLFEDRLTVQYQIQEMLRIERIFEASGIQEELDAYNPLIPDGSNLKATMLFEFPDPGIRAERLSQLGGIEHRLYAEVAGQPRIFAHADEDMDRSNEKKTSAVHFVRFEFGKVMRDAVRAGASVKLGCDHTNYPAHVDIPAETLASLAGDLH